MIGPGGVQDHAASGAQYMMVLMPAPWLRICIPMPSSAIRRRTGDPQICVNASKREVPTNRSDSAIIASSALTWEEGWGRVALWCGRTC